MSEDVASPQVNDAENLPDTVEWFENLPDDLRSEKTLEKFKSHDGVEKLATSFINLEKRLGSSILIPGNNATTEEVNEYRRKLGVPESADKYTFKYKEHEAVKVDENADKAFKELALKIGLNPKQAQDLIDFDCDRFIASHEAGKKSYENAIEEAKKEFGAEYETVLNKANNALNKFADAKDMENIKTLENDIRLVRLLAKVDDAMSEHAFVGGNKVSPENVREDLTKKADELMRIYTDDSKDWSERKRAEAEAHAIFSKLHGDKQVSGTMQLMKD
jgi:hypothetical protein